MISNNLPTKLKKEPLIDAVFEIRFTSALPASSILPGFLFGKLEGNKAIETLPAAQLPKPLRDADPNLQFAPLSRLAWGGFFVNISDYSLSVACKIPYPGWSNFKTGISTVVGSLSDIGIILAIERCSLKYIDLIPSSSIEQQIAFVNMDVLLAGHRLTKEVFQVHMEIPRDGFINIVRVTSSASVVLPNGDAREGVVIDIDTIHNIENESLREFSEGLLGRLEKIHASNKSMFFDCLKEEAIKMLEPVYD